ncbi:Lrp/AsnC family transcriptional regulator [Candidatus Micrarchaeota archaeon]|nr:Lrp/AsnC family transcriptional regulator [Candidatus Micrarchaeota archaeon]
MEQKIDKLDCKILAELDKNCRVSDGVLAKRIKRSRQTVAYRINRLVKDGVITGFYAAINPNKMGHRLFKIYLKFRNIPKRREELISYLRQSMNVYWMGECDGSWDIIFALYAKDEYMFYSLKNELLSTFKDIIVDFYGDYLLDVKQYPKMYFTGKLEKPVEFGGVVVQNKLDSLDFRILDYVIGNARAPTVEIAKRVSSTPPTVSSRLKKLEKLGVIIQYRIGVNLIRLGLEYYKAIVRLESHTSEELKELLEYCSQLPEIQYFIRNLWQIEPEFVVRNYNEYYDIINKLKEKFPQTIKTVDSVILRTDEWTPGFKKMMMPTS